MKHLLERIKKYKWGFIGLAAIVLLMILVVVFEKEPVSTTLPPVITETPETREQDKVYFITANPPSGRRETPDSFATVEFEFSMPIDLNSVSIITRPFMKLEQRVYEHSPNKLFVWPSTQPWNDKQEYTIIIKTLEAPSGERLAKPVTYTYYNETPEIVHGGEDWMLEETQGN